MLDEMEIVRAMLACYPTEPVGPHGIPLRKHAEVGGAENVLALLNSAG
jgi:hypothetical protein